MRAYSVGLRMSAQAGLLVYSWGVQATHGSSAVHAMTNPEVTQIWKRDESVVPFQPQKTEIAVHEALAATRAVDGELGVLAEEMVRLVGAGFVGSIPTDEGVRQTCLLAYELGCRVITVYRYGSKKRQVLYLAGHTLEEEPIGYIT